MRKIIIILASVVTVFLVVAAVIPLVFKEDIRIGVEKALDDNLDADIYFDASKFGLTLFKNFPNPTASMNQFGIIGVDDFDGDTLLSVQDFDITIDLFSLFGKNYSIKSINLVRPRLNVLVLESGKSNYEIVSSDATESEEEGDNSSNFNLAIDQWNISEGQINYVDKSSNFRLRLKDVSHTGGGNLSMQQYDLRTKTKVGETLLNYDGINYLNGESIFADADLLIDLEDYSFTFRNNHFTINDFPLSFDGSIAMPAEDIIMDLSFAAENSDVKSLYSLIPGVYTEEYENVIAQGEMSFLGLIKGVYNETSLPSFNMALKVSEGMISYPELPTAIDNINVDMVVDCSDGILENTRIEVKLFHIDLGENPINGSLLIRNLHDYSIKADVDARINLAELSSIFPIEETELRGQFIVNLKADGIYDSISGTMPSIEARMSLKEGFIKNAQFPRAIDHISFDGKADCLTGNMKDMQIEVNSFDVTMANQGLSGALNLYDLVDYHWYLKLKGGLDLQVISEVYPLEGINYSGLINSDIETEGKFSDIEAARYSKVMARGSLSLKDFIYKSDELQQGFSISESSVSVDPKVLVLESFDGKSGNSDIALNGSISNYFDYIFKGDAMLKGQMELTSNTLDLNEWITGEETASEGVEDTIALEVLQLPTGVDLEFKSEIEHIYYDDLDLRNAKGLIAIKDGVLDLKQLSFDLLGGAITMNGKYNSRTADLPRFDYNIEIKSLSIPRAFTSFSTVQAFAPMAEVMEGAFSAKFNIGGLLNNDMSPVFSTLNGKGVLEIADATLMNSNLVSTISGFVNTGIDSKALKLQDVVIKTSLENGRAHVLPFDVSMGGQQANISGSIGADGSLDYIVKTEIDAGMVGQKVNQLLAELRGENENNVDSKILLNFNVSGTYEDPNISLAGTSKANGKTNAVKESAKVELKKQADRQLEEIKTTAEETLKDETTKLVEKSEDKLQEQLDTLKEEITKNLSKEGKEILEDQMDSTTNELQQSIKNLFKKKKN